jgi:hypothetical protein
MTAVGEPQLSEGAATMLAALLEEIRALESLPLEDVPPALGDSSAP